MIPNLPAGFVQFCAAHNRAGCGCLTMTVSASDDTLWIHALPQDGDTVSISSVFGIERVSLPSAPVEKNHINWADATHCVWCEAPLPHTCGPHIIDGVERTVTNNEIDPPAEEAGLPPPTGWRDRPGLL